MVAELHEYSRKVYKNADIFFKTFPQLLKFLAYVNVSKIFRTMYERSSKRYYSIDVSM